MSSVKIERSKVIWVAAGAICGLIVLLPVSRIIEYALFGPAGFTTSYISEWFNPDHWSSIVNSVITAGAVTIGAVVFGIPLTYVVVRADTPLRSWFRTIVLASYVIPSFLTTFAYIILLGPGAGWINMIFVSLFRLTQSPFDIFSLGGMILIETVYSIPYVFLTVSSALTSMDGSLEEAARITGASRLKTFLTVTLPIIRPAVGASALLVFVSAIATLGVPTILRINVLTTRIYRFLGYPPRFEIASSLSILLMLAGLTSLYFYRRMTWESKRYVTLVSGARPPERTRLGWLKVPALLFCSSYACLSIILPLFAILSCASWEAVGKGFVLSNYTLKHFSYVARDSLAVAAIKNSLLYAALASTGVVALASVVSFIVVRLRTKFSSVLDYLSMLPFGIPSVALAVGVFLTYVSPPFVLYGTMWILVIAYMTAGLPMATRIMSASVTQIDQTLEESSRITGASWAQTFTRIDIPLLKPAVMSGWMLVFIASFRELSQSLLLVSPGTEVLSYVLMNYWQLGTSLQLVSAFSGLALIMIIAMFAVSQILLKGKAELVTM